MYQLSLHNNPVKLVSSSSSPSPPFHGWENWGTQKLNNSLKTPMVDLGLFVLEHGIVCQYQAPLGSCLRQALSKALSNTLICVFAYTVLWDRYHYHSPPNCTDKETKAKRSFPTSAGSTAGMELGFQGGHLAPMSMLHSLSGILSWWFDRKWFDLPPHTQQYVYQL